MTIQYVKDKHNITTAVLIPISDWEKIVKTHQDINLLLNPKSEINQKKKPSDFRGCISSDTADKLIAHIEESRNEWNNDF